MINIKNLTVVSQPDRNTLVCRTVPTDGTAAAEVVLRREVHNFDVVLVVTVNGVTVHNSVFMPHEKNEWLELEASFYIAESSAFSSRKKLAVQAAKAGGLF
jgi:hypothetical protein